MNRTLSLVLASVLLAGCGGGGHSGGGGAGNGGTASKVRFESILSSQGTAFPIDITGDGSLIVGSSHQGEDSARFWRNPASAQSFSVSTDLWLHFAVAVSLDGANTLCDATRANENWKVVLMSSRGPLTLPLPAGATSGYGLDLSDDGTVALCTDAIQTTPFDPRPYVVRNGVATYLPLPPGTAKCYVSALSGDGTTVVGSIDGKPARWVNDAAPEILGVENGAARAVDRDGSVIVGVRQNPSLGSLGFRWTTTSGMTDLIVHGTEVDPAAISPDGKTVLVNATVSSVGQGVVFLWREGFGATPVTDLITQAGGDASVFTGAYARTFSADGKTIIGAAKRSEFGNLAAAWKLTLP